MRIASIEFEAEGPKSSIMASKNRFEEIRANKIRVEWTRHHVVFHFAFIKKNGKVVEDTIAYPALKVLGLTISDEDEE
jgi:hypothetical protein